MTLRSPRRALGLLALAALVPLAPTAADTQRAPTRTVRLVTWNVGTLDPLHVRLPARYEDDVVEALAAEAPDVVGLQEIDGEAQVRRLTTALRRRGLDYGFVSGASDPRRADGRSMAILYRGEALATPSLQTDVAEGFTVRGVVLAGITVVSVHAPTSLTHRQAFYPQVLEWAETLPGPVVMLGDLNTGPRRGAGTAFFLPWLWKYDRALYRSLTEAFPVHTTLDDTTVYEQVYDHIMATEGRIVRQEVLGAHRHLPQDHEPVVVDLELPVEQPQAGIVGALQAR